jgi:diguanylate cyclase (GGDEF)-like protein
MLHSSGFFAIAIGVSLCVAALSTSAWLRCRRRLEQSRREREALEKSSNLLEVERHVVDLMDRGASLTEVLDVLTRTIEGMAPECLCSVLLLDEQGQHLWKGSGGGLPDEFVKAMDGLAIGPEAGACGTAAYRNETVVVEDIATDPRFATVKDYVMSFGLRATWSVPVRGVNGKVLGTFAMYHRHRAKPRDRELAIVEDGARLAAHAIERRRATERIRENADRIELAEKAAFLGIWELNVTRGVLTLSQELAGQVGMPDAAHRVNMKQLRTMIHSDDWKPLAAALKQAVAAGKPFHAELRVVLYNGHIRWLRVQARIEFEYHRPRRLIGVSVDITREKEMVKELQYLAAHDSLTGIWNRKAIFDLMHREFDMASRTGTMTGMMMLDLDHFKNVNDTYGHPAGDAVLKESVRRVQLAMRSYDLVGRYGGEEFLVVLPGCDRELVRQCSERVRMAIAEEPMLVDGEHIHVTVSVGATVVNPALITEQEALATADAALYHAKNSGRNRSVDLQPAQGRSATYRDFSRYSH